MQVKIFATLRAVAGGEKAVEIDASDVRGLLVALRSRYGAAFTEELLEGGGLRPGVVLLVNGVNVHAMRGLDTPLTANDTVAIFPVLGGG